MKRVLVTGANKGIGFEIVKGLLKNGCFVFLGSRDVALGQEAVKSLSESERKMVEVVQLDVTDQISIAKAVKAVTASCNGEPLSGLMNNAGGAKEMGYTSHEDFEWTVDLNFGGVLRTTQAFLPILAKNGRIVMTSSGAAPMFVSQLAPEKQKIFLAVEENTELSLEQILAFLDECRSISARSGGKTDGFVKAGFGNCAPYGLAKACINAYSVVLARTNPGMTINACTPGFIETDLVRTGFQKLGKTPSELGALPVERGAISPLYLMLEDVLPGSGWFFGSDTRRSPPHLYRNPGTAAYDGSGTFSEASNSNILGAKSSSAKL